MEYLLVDYGTTKGFNDNYHYMTDGKWEIMNMWLDPEGVSVLWERVIIPTET